DATLQYLPAASASTEKSGSWGGWPECGVPARSNGQPGAPSLLFGCVDFSLGASTYTGAVLQFKFQCQTDGASPIDLPSRTADPGGSHFIDQTSNPVDPALTGSQVLCGSGVLPSVGPPDTAIVAGPSGKTTDRTPTFRFTSTASPPAFDCKVDSLAFATCGSPRTTAKLGPGKHDFQVRARDATGGVDPTPASRSFTVAASKKACARLKGKRLRRCKARARCKKLSAKKRKKCLSKARRVGRVASATRT
ncbi:MAG: hypothetical protein WD336_10530, partial [Trueperaceae bacterium]